jgi:ATP-dependent DNA helicase RecG
VVTLTTSVKTLKGVGPSKVAALSRLGIKTVDDLLHHFPSGYYFAPPRTDGPLIEGHPATVSGIVRSVRIFNRNFEVILDTGVRVMWFGGRYLRESIFKGSCLMVSGIVTYGGFTNPEWKVYKEWDETNESDLNTVTYLVTSGITSKEIGRLARQCLLAVQHSLHPYYHAIHRPHTQEEADTAREYFKRDELFYMQLALAVRQAKRAQELPNVQCNLSIPIVNKIYKYFPFEFTVDQCAAVGEILADFQSSCAMNRLLQGDVGCGKTAVAAYAAIVMAFNGGQTAILCPTEILARQHYETIKGYFERAGVRCDLVVSGSCVECANIDRPIYEGQIVIGTTALLRDEWGFKNLGLVVIDEQHKFGVEQRAALRRHGNPHVLTMTATPIPRTIAMTVFGDLDVSTIMDMPPGRLPVETYWIHTGNTWREVGVRIQLELAAGHQVYVVCPRIGALDYEMRAVEEVLQEYRRLFPNTPIMALHGQMPAEEKQRIARWWAAPGLQGAILVSTTVVEVGVDNPNATVMVIEGAERFGLAQLHQLRGRVGRGPDQSYCLLLSDTDSTEARSRLRAMEQTNDGFEIAEQDLKLRGPGDLLSTRQHGLPDLKIADLVEDYELLVATRNEVRAMVVKGLLPASVQTELERRYGSSLQLGDAA